MAPRSLWNGTISFGLIRVPVKVYTNLDAVTLQVNGEAMAAGTSGDHVFSWPSIALRTGANTIVATGKSGTSTITDTVTWTRM